jgi:hypothetical protein
MKMKKREKRVEKGGERKGKDEIAIYEIKIELSISVWIRLSLILLSYLFA